MKDVNIKNQSKSKETKDSQIFIFSDINYNRFEYCHGQHSNESKIIHSVQLISKMNDITKICQTIT